MVTHKTCGGIIFRKEEDKIKYLLVKHCEKGGGHWDFPKGHVEKGEIEEETALREIYEETGLKVEIVKGFKEQISYFDHVNKVDKIVIFFVCKANSKEVKHITDDVEDHVWLSYDEALNKLTYDNSKNILKKAEKFINSR